MISMIIIGVSECICIALYAGREQALTVDAARNMIAAFAVYFTCCCMHTRRNC